MKKGYLSSDTCLKIQAVPSGKSINDTFRLNIPIYKLCSFDFDVYMMQYNPMGEGEDLRDKDLWYIFANKKTNDAPPKKNRIIYTYQW